MSQYEPNLPSPPDLCMLAAGDPPAGTISNFENPETLVPVLISICSLLLVVAVIFTICRVFANRRKLWWSDYFVIIATILSIAHNGLLFTQTKTARHQWDVRACWLDGAYLKTLFSLEIISTFTLFFSKVSIFLLFHQIFEVRRLMRIAIRCGIIFTTLVYIVTNVPLSTIFTVPHVGETWAGTLVGRDTEPEVIWGIVQAVLGTALDLFIFILPIPGIMRLHLSTKKKIQVLAVFTTASVGVLASILSLVYRVAALDMNDITWAYMSMIICNAVETDVAIIASCTPGFASFIRTYIPKLKVFKSLRSNGTSDVNLNYDHNKQGAEKGFRRPINHFFDPLDDIYIPQSTSSAGQGMSKNFLSFPAPSVLASPRT